MEVVVRVGRKGVVVIPKRFREMLGLREGSYVVMEVRDGVLVVRPFSFRRIRLGGGMSEILAEFRREEMELGG